MNPIDMGAVIDELRKPNGWQKGSLGAYDEPVGAVCLMGALSRVAGNRLLSAVDDLMRDTLAPIIQQQFSDRVDSGWPPTFNDHPDTTLDDVILVCEKARAEQ